MLSNPEGEEGHYTCTYKLHTREVPPRVLRRELEKLLGSTQWQVEMRHNVYNIQCSTNFNIKDLLSNCQKGDTTPRTFSAQSLRERALNASTPRRLPDTPQIHLVTLNSAESSSSRPTIEAESTNTGAEHITIEEQTTSLRQHS